MKQIAMVVAVLLVLTPVVNAADSFTNHIDLFQVTAHNGKARVLDIGYHFTLFRVGKRLELLGLGGGVDFFNIDDENGITSPVVSPFLMVPIASVALSRHQDDMPGFSFGASYTYNVHWKEHLVSFGFSLTF